ncbi:hypothetical protein [Photobacterium gaetbulicola]|uniref:hypothetical protein n=1 Tax=Photobacterium gaetbulicola TaxID=1295392 RepID=UPI0011B2529C|nr:hypothetical protein [Photobacterium gaetbulicola]
MFTESVEGRAMGDGRWAMGDGRWAMGDGRWAMQSFTVASSCQALSSSRSLALLLPIAKLLCL